MSFSLTGSAYLAMMGSNWLNPSNYQKRALDDSAWLESSNSMALGHLGSSRTFNGIDIFDRGAEKGAGHNAGKPLRFLARTVCIAAIMILCPPIDIAIDVACMSYHSFRWLSSLGKNKQASEHLSSRFYQLCTHVGLLFLVVMPLLSARGQPSALGPKATAAVVGLFTPLIFSLYGAVQHEAALSMFLPYEHRQAALTAILLKEHGGIESEKGGLAKIEAKDSLKVFEEMRKITAELLLENIKKLQASFQLGSRMEVHYPPNLKMIADFCLQNPDVYFTMKQAKLLKAITKYSLELSALDQMAKSIQIIRDRNLFVETLFKTGEPEKNPSFPIAKEEAEKSFRPEKHVPLIDDDTVLPEDFKLEVFEPVKIPTAATEDEKILLGKINKYAAIEDPYLLLGLTGKEDVAAIQRRARPLLFLFHPDKWGRKYGVEEATRIFKKMNAASEYCQAKVKV